MDIEQYIRSGMVETYALGLATASERAAFEELLVAYPALKTALSEFEYRLERFALIHETPPPPEVRERIEAQIK